MKGCVIETLQMFRKWRILNLFSPFLEHHVESVAGPPLSIRHSHHKLRHRGPASILHRASNQLTYATKKLQHETRKNDNKDSICDRPKNVFPKNVFLQDIACNIFHDSASSISWISVGTQKQWNVIVSRDIFDLKHNLNWKQSLIKLLHIGTCVCKFFYHHRLLPLRMDKKFPVLSFGSIPWCQIAFCT